ncbi:Phosphoenolpyruvate synthase regulatory protein [Andreprevotia sp. IGB-42]|uniref:posphoenolpyruvate synthetase regulatory kinase/phosphorylase PpsR n=1 Tax=Andreprevotia sp. IGB-42 TaxID=2497473 RepID=UPI001356C71E|nr:pyruvate, water dikinase regulatory protein [Andreprevotia sp. IGB-42]KAF0813225.1 Phosphoenolpyruvate synthase regulatory protein [Andreprevotia sp. IGB-42]
MPRTAFFISDRTGITAEMLGHSLITQFEDVNFRRVTLPYVDTPEKALKVAEQIRRQAAEDQCQPLVFSTIVGEELRKLIAVEEALTLDFFEIFIGPLEKALGRESSHTVGKSHGIVNFEEYKTRIDAVNFALAHDDGVMPRDLNDADIILVGVSRSAKTPTCLYLALQYGIKAANYPLTPEDFGNHTLPKLLLPYRNKLFGLTIDPVRLNQIREERKPGSRYAALDNCEYEVAEAEVLMRQVGVPHLSSTTRSIEELATSIMHTAGLTRRTY